LLAIVEEKWRNFSEHHKVVPMAVFSSALAFLVQNTRVRKYIAAVEHKTLTWYNGIA
jgi:hypothetical protein